MLQFSSSRLLLAAIGLTLAFRLWLAAALPMTGDEAYFIWWGKVPDWGFYDHPPMIGWWLAALLKIGSSEAWLRLPQVLEPAVLALGVRWFWPRLFPDMVARRDWVALLVLLAPVNVWNVLVTTDTALVFFAVFAGLSWLRAARDDSLGWYALCGIFLAGAVLSKYFVALLGFAFLIDVLRRRTRGAVLGLLIAYAVCVPALALMAWWNSEHCWPNYMFNFVNRHRATGMRWETPLLYVAMLLYMLTPPGLWALFRSRPAGVDFSATERGLVLLAGLPFLLFAVLSIYKTIGLHWPLSFVPFVMLLVARRTTAAGLHRLVVFLLGFAALHIAIALFVSRLPLETWQNRSFYASMVLTFEGRELVRQAAPGESLLVSDGYSNAVILGYNIDRYVPVLGDGSSHARHDDILTDWRTHDGRDMTILRKSAPDPGEYDHWFHSVSQESFEYRGARFWVVRGRGFVYSAYRDTALAEVRRKYYALPHRLPQSGCYFCDRYFPGQQCVR